MRRDEPVEARSHNHTDATHRTRRVPAACVLQTGYAVHNLCAFMRSVSGGMPAQRCTGCGAVLSPCVTRGRGRLAGW